MSAKKLWQGVFKGANVEVVRFNSGENIELDQQLVEYDIFGSLAHVKMLAKQGILTKEESDSIINALNSILTKNKAGKIKLDPDLEDVHTNIEALASTITLSGKKMHIARSRNDQILVDMRMYLRDESLSIVKYSLEFQKSFAELATKKEGLMVGYTHTRVAQPITVSFWCDAQVQGLNRDIERILNCYKRINTNPLGAGAIAGSGWNIDREYTTKLLGFDSVQENELDTISSRGEMEAELLSHLAVLMVRLSGLSEELIWLSQKDLIKIPDEFCTGSSMMPNKKNPDVLELIRGRAARVHANLMHVLGVKKGLISGHHGDTQETKYAVMMGINMTKECLAIFAPLMQDITFDQNKIQTELETGYAQATEIADALAYKGVPFREAHGIVGKLVNQCRASGIPLSKTKPIAPLSALEWKNAVTLDRKRLKRSVKLRPEQETFVKSETKRISNVYRTLAND